MTKSAAEVKEALKQFQTAILPYIQEIFANEIANSKPAFNPITVKVLETLQDITCRGAKRLRGSFVYKTYQLYGGTQLDIAMKVAAAVEIIHAYLLIIDDIMDISDSRRGGPTAHIIFRDLHKSKFHKNDSYHFGESIAMNAGQIGAHLANELISKLDADPKILLRIITHLNRNIITTSHGQVTDMLNENISYNQITEQDIFNVLEWKTGVYTYENPIHTGPVLAGAPDSELEKLSKYAIPAGIAFQIQDDILGTFGKEDTTGKSNMDDIKEGKMTLLAYKALEKATSSQKQLLERSLGNRNLTESDYNDTKQIMIDTGSLQYSKDTALKFVLEAKNSLDTVGLKVQNPEHLDYLRGIADYMIEREL